MASDNPSLLKIFSVFPVFLGLNYVFHLFPCSSHHHEYTQPKYFNPIQFKRSESRSVMSNSLQPHRLYGPWDSPGKNTGGGSRSLLQGIFPTHGMNQGLPHCRQILYCLSHKGSPRILEGVAVPFSRGPSWPRNGTGVSCIHCRWIFYQLSHQGSPSSSKAITKPDVSQSPASRPRAGQECLHREPRCPVSVIVRSRSPLPRHRAGLRPAALPHRCPELALVLLSFLNKTEQKQAK